LRNRRQVEISLLPVQHALSHYWKRPAFFESAPRLCHPLINVADTPERRTCWSHLSMSEKLVIYLSNDDVGSIQNYLRYIYWYVTLDDKNTYYDVGILDLPLSPSWRVFLPSSSRWRFFPRWTFALFSRHRSPFLWLWRTTKLSFALPLPWFWRRPGALLLFDTSLHN